MFRNKKADMTLNLIIGAAIAMIVLVVLVLIFTGRMNIFAGRGCADAGGAITASDQCGTNGQLNPICIIPGPFKDDKPGSVCCNLKNKDCHS